MKQAFLRWMLTAFCLLASYFFAMSGAFPNSQSLLNENVATVGAFADQVCVLTPTPAPVALFVPTLEKEEMTPFSIEVLAKETPKPVGSVLIYHTHTYEAYQQQPEDPYPQTEAWRTANNAYNVVGVGEELTAMLQSMGISVTHDQSAFEMPDLGSAYARSLEMLEARAQNQETYDLYLDLHRDAYQDDLSNTVNIGGTDVAKLLILVGKGEGQTGAGFDKLPNWEENLKNAAFLTDALNAQYDGLCKPVRLSASRYNQHISTNALLIEVGMNQNTLKEALSAIPYLADAIADFLRR